MRGDKQKQVLHKTHTVVKYNHCIDNCLKWLSCSRSRKFLVLRRAKPPPRSHYRSRAAANQSDLRQPLAFIYLLLALFSYNLSVALFPTEYYAVGKFGFGEGRPDVGDPLAVGRHAALLDRTPRLGPELTAQPWSES